VVAPAKRRRRTSAYKLRIIAEADACEQRGDLGALLRREGVYHSDLANWRKQKAQGLLGGSPASRYRRADPAFQDALKQQTELARENRALRRQLGRAKLIIEIQKKAALLLGETLQEMSLDDDLESDLD
jgi:transposase-like protein